MKTKVSVLDLKSEINGLEKTKGFPKLNKIFIVTAPIQMCVFLLQDIRGRARMRYENLKHAQVTMKKNITNWLRQLRY